MFLADWSGRRVAAYAILWLVGFPVVMTVFTIMGGMASSGSGGFTVGAPSLSPRDSAWRDSVVREMMRRNSIRAAEGRSFDTAAAIAFLPTQSSDVMVSPLTVSEDDGSGYGAAELLPWLLPPALLVAAWAWTRRSRPEPD